MDDAAGPVTFLTALHTPTGQHFEAAIDSVAALRAAGAPLRWVVHEDGSDEWGDRLAAHRWISHDHSDRPIGAAAARNVGLQRVQTAWVVVLDHDDVVLPAMARLLAAVAEAPPHRGWVAGRALDLLPDGRLVPHAGEQIPAGSVEAGTTTSWLERVGEYPLHCAGMAVRTDAVRALGGWVATPRSEDVALMAVLTHLTAGLVLDDAVWAYRRWAGQTRDTPGWTSRRALGAEIVGTRLRAVRRMGLRLGGQPSPPDGA